MVFTSKRCQWLRGHGSREAVLKIAAEGTCDEEKGAMGIGLSKIGWKRNALLLEILKMEK